MNSTHVQLTCIAPRIIKPLSRRGFVGLMLGKRNSEVKLLITFRSDRPGGRVLEVHVVLDRYLEYYGGGIVYLKAWYGLCRLHGQ